eukprot:TRINITY_DN4611_c0_g1_i1.p1 TRINITY_DN4611_c0_g1~~TRINITY_DN4611_c0_g1_i1.p1  ORF type:complete len:577 (-),score=88.11 TRINITY_DN4611_c0_g1_i1:175-1905(-)
MEDIRYGSDVKLLINKLDQEQFLLKQKAISSQQIEYDLKFSNKEKTLSNPYIFRLLDVSVLHNKSFCGEMHMIQKLYEYSSSDLSQEIEVHKQQQQFFSQSEILTMIDSVLNALLYLRLSEIYHGGIQPKNIYPMKNGTYKIYNYRSLTEGQSSYQQIVLGIDLDIYLSPQLFVNVCSKKIIPNYFDREKSDVFSLGMTALSMATLKNLNSCYDYNKGSVSMEQIKQLLDSLQENKVYDKKLLQYIQQLLEPNENQRLNFQNALLNLQHFNSQIIHPYGILVYDQISPIYLSPRQEHQQLQNNQNSFYSNNNFDQNYIQSTRNNIFLSHTPLQQEKLQVQSGQMNQEEGERKSISGNKKNSHGSSQKLTQISYPEDYKIDNPEPSSKSKEKQQSSPKQLHTFSKSPSFEVNKELKISPINPDNFKLALQNSSTQKKQNGTFRVQQLIIKQGQTFIIHKCQQKQEQQLIRIKTTSLDRQLFLQQQFCQKRKSGQVIAMMDDFFFFPFLILPSFFFIINKQIMKENKKISYITKQINMHIIMNKYTIFKLKPYVFLYYYFFYFFIFDGTHIQLSLIHI